MDEQTCLACGNWDICAIRKKIGGGLELLRTTTKFNHSSFKQNEAIVILGKTIGGMCSYYVYSGEVESILLAGVTNE